MPDVVPMHFALGNVSREVSDVTVVGSWAGWNVHWKLLRKEDSTFAGWIEVPHGKHHFKFIVDGQAEKHCLCVVCVRAFEHMREMVQRPEVRTYDRRKLDHEQRISCRDGRGRELQQRS